MTALVEGSGLSHVQIRQESLPFGEKGVLFVPKGTKAITDWVYAGRDDTQRAVIPEGVIAIGRGDFSCCTNLKEILLPGTLRTIDPEAF